MKTAYRIPGNACACVAPGAKPATTVPINRFNVRSFITNLSDGAQIRAGGDIVIKGIAFDGGYGVTDVTVSADNGRTWQAAKLGEDLGRYSFREWQSVVHLEPGAHVLKARAVNRIGQSQPLEQLWNPAGYMRNIVETVTVIAA
jgi:sulfite dehydrogenase